MSSAFEATEAAEVSYETFDNGSEWVDATFTARRFGIESRVVVSWGVWAAVQAGRLTMGELMTALRQGAEQAAGPSHVLALGTVPATSASALGDTQAGPVYGVRFCGESVG